MLNWSEGIIGAIRRRLLATHLDAIAKDPRAKPRATKLRRKPLTARLAADSAHSLVEGDGWFRCVACLGSAARSSCNSFLRSSCRPAAPAAPGFMQELGRAQVGKKRVHPSHRVSWNDGVCMHFCVECGGTSKVTMRKLALPCSGKLNRGGRDALSRLRRHLAPGSSAAAAAFNGDRTRPKKARALAKKRTLHPVFF